MEFSVVAYWQAIAAKAGDTRSWDQLPLQHQQQVIASINMLLQVLHDPSKR
ncbi:hypothetical protein P26059A_0067 [Curvibacter phage P26059A]|nr:hypothetical protein P26059A_0067 [Curvibacter phage P26059A]